MTTIERRTAVVTIFQGDYLDRIRHLEARYEAALKAEKAGPPRTLGEIPLSVELATEHEQLVAEAEQHAVKITVGALSRKVWRKLVAEHPAREGNEADAAVGVNEDVFKDALVMFDQVVDGERCRTIVAPDLTEAEIDRLSDADFDRVYYAAFGLNRSPGAGPKVLRASQANQASDATLS